MTFPPKAAFFGGFLNPRCSLIKEGKWWWGVTVGKADGEKLDFLQVLLFWPTPRAVVNKSGPWFPPFSCWTLPKYSRIVGGQHRNPCTASSREKWHTTRQLQKWHWEQGLWEGTSFPGLKKPVSQAAEGWWALGGDDDTLINAWSGSKLWSLCWAGQDGN